jgi:hypothetical protein
MAEVDHPVQTQAYNFEVMVTVTGIIGYSNRLNLYFTAMSP